MHKGALIEMCENISAEYLRVWELGREAVKFPNGPSEDDVMDMMERMFLWRDIADRLRHST